MPFLFLFFWCIIHIIYGIPTWRPTLRPTLRPNLIYPTWRPTLRPNFISPTWRPTPRPSTAPTNRPTTPTRYPSDSPTNAPTMSPTIYFVPMKNLYDIECNDLQDSYDVIYDISVDDCNYMCSRDRNCVMIHYLHYLKSNNDNRCYLYDKVCDIEYTFNAQQSILGYKTEEATCQNYPYYWRDKSNNQCYYYSSYNLCNNGSVTNENYTSIILNAKNVNDISAIDACCQCGGGVYNYDSIQLFHFNKNNYNRFNNEVIRELYLDKQIKKWNNLMLYYVSTKHNVKNSETFDSLMFNLDDIIPNKVYLCELTSIDMEISKYFVLIKQYNIYINKQWTNLNDSYNPSIIETISYNNCTSQIDFSDNFIGFYPINALQLYAPTSFPTALPEAVQQNIPADDKPKASPAVVAMFVVCGVIICIMGLILIYCWKTKQPIAAPNNTDSNGNELATMNTGRTRTMGGETNDTESDNFFHINVFIKNSEDIVTIKCKESYTIKKVRQLIKANYDVNGSLKVLKTLDGTKLDNKQFTLSQYDISGTTNLIVKIKPFIDDEKDDQ